MIGYTELILIFLVVFLLFGAKRIPDLAKALGLSLIHISEPTRPY